MKRILTPALAVLVFGLVVALTALAAGDAQEPDYRPANEEVPTTTTLELPEYRVAVDLVQFACLGPKPADIGCNVICKPCITYVCKAGSWVPLSITIPDEFCDREPVGSSGFNTCRRSSTGFCPAECHVCI